LIASRIRSQHARWGRAGLAKLPFVLLALLALLVTGGPAIAQTAEPLDDYVIGPEDVLEIRMPEHPELGAKVPVRPDGRITLPLVDDVVAAGLTPEALKATLVAAFKGYVTVPNISVIVVEINSLKIFVLGEVLKPGMFPLRSRTRVLQAIALAGGFTQYAAKDRVVLLRDTEGRQARIEINLKKVTAGDDIAANQLLRPGDTLVVP
jgi:polysaccharide export outer membrane protein